VRLLVNTVYAFLAEKAEADDRAELAMVADVDDKHRKDMCRNRAELDAMLSAPMGRTAEAEKALLRELGRSA
jgi:hypothetical protein